MSSPYHNGSRALQDRFDTRRLADRLDEKFLSRPVIDEADREFIERMDMFFLATADAEGRPQCSYKGGDPGFVRVLDEQTVAFPNYDGNGMYLSMGNLLENPHVGMLFIDFVSARPSRLRLNGIATIDEQDRLINGYPGAQFIVRVCATQVFPNCPRYIHRMALVQRSRFVPRPDRKTPVPDWKRSDWACDVLPEDDPAGALSAALNRALKHRNGDPVSAGHGAFKWADSRSAGRAIEPSASANALGSEQIREP